MSLKPLIAVLFISILVLLSVINESNEFGSPGVQVRASFPYEKLPVFPELNADAYGVKILGEDVYLAKRKEWKKLPPASLTKVLTGVLAYENLRADERIVFSEEAKNTEAKLSTTKVGETFLRDDVLAFAIMASANDAALALAQEFPTPAFRELMSKKAEELGMENSRFVNPAGLDEEGHYSSIEDLIKLTEYVWIKHPKLWALSRTVEKTVLSSEFKEHRVFNTNELLKEFPAILGGKTGFTDLAKGALLLIYPLRPDKVTVSVILKSEDRFGDGRKIIRWLESVDLN